MLFLSPLIAPPLHTTPTNFTLQRIAVLGFAFKADTGDTRESAAITLIRDFLSERARVNVYDPKVTEEQIWLDLDEARPDLGRENSEFLLLFGLGGRG